MKETTAQGASSDGSVRDCRRFEGTTASVPRARHFIMETLARLPATTLDSVEMMVSELASNCVLHAATEFEICVIRVGGSLRVEVTDFGVGVPVPLPPDTERLGGRGLLIVGQLADDWGVTRQTGGTGKTVWFTVDPGS
jgi:anti-sigma regulatory factor (Ser/Thr protein kinase)